MPRLIVVIILVCLTFGYSNASDDGALLRELDEMVENRAIFHHNAERSIDSLRRQLRYAYSDSSRFEMLGRLFNKYRSFQIDTAMLVAEERLRLAKKIGNEDLVDMATMNIADAFNKMGRYENALETLDKVRRTPDVKKDVYFYYLYHTTYLSLYYDEINSSHKQEYWRKLKSYKDTLETISDPGSASYVGNKCGILRMEGKTDEAIGVLKDYYAKNVDSGNPDKASLEYLLSDLYLDKRDTINALHWLILSSMTDIANAKKVYKSLQRLAVILYYQGDVDRAYNYISCALEDINSGKARYRMVDIAEYFPIINAAADSRVKTDKVRVYWFVGILALLVVALVAELLFIRSRNAKLQAAKQSLAEQYGQLQKMAEDLKRNNAEIIESKHISEEYIGLLFNICSEYISKQESLKKNLLKIVNSGSIADIAKVLKSQSSTSADFKIFINRFDSIFLSIFPNFVESFNSLLRDDEQVKLKDGELLSPELRIYALIRLGICDNSKIAHFLHYSLQTVYNYRLRMRNKAKSPTRDLAAQVQKL